MNKLNKEFLKQCNYYYQEPKEKLRLLTGIDRIQSESIINKPFTIDTLTVKQLLSVGEYCKLTQVLTLRYADVIDEKIYNYGQIFKFIQLQLDHCQKGKAGAEFNFDQVAYDLFNTNLQHTFNNLKKDNGFF